MDIKDLKALNKINGEIWVNDFTTESALSFRDDVLQESNSDPSKPIVIYINSGGGQVDSLASMIETMDEVPNPFITVCHGTAMSAGAILLSHGDLRFCGTHSRVMIHEVSGGSAGDVHDVAADAEEIKRLNKHFMNLLAKNCGIKGGYDALRKMIKDQDGRDNYLNAEQAVEFGIVDSAGLPRVEKTTVYQINRVPNKEALKNPNKKSDRKR